jgi:hypothetical protein
MPAWGSSLRTVRNSTVSAIPQSSSAIGPDLTPRASLGRGYSAESNQGCHSDSDAKLIAMGLNPQLLPRSHGVSVQYGLLSASVGLRPIPSAPHQ